MQITTTNLYAKVQYGKDSFTHPLNTVSYVINDGYDGVTLFRNNEVVGTGLFEEVTVNGITLDAGNADLLLSKLFGCCCGGGSGNTQTDYLEEDTQSPAYLKNRPVSKVHEGDDFPQPVAPGHRCMVYDEADSLLFVYEWDGFIWEMKGADYNLIFDTYNSQAYDSLFPFKKRKEDTYYFYMKPGESLLSSLKVSDIHKISSKYYIYNVIFHINKDYDKLSLEDFNIRTLDIQSSSEDRPVPFQIGKLDIRNATLRSLYMQQRFNAEIIQLNLENIKPSFPEEGVSLDSYAKNISILNNENCSGIMADIQHSDSDPVQQSKVIICNNTLKDYAQINISGSYDTVGEYDLYVTNNAHLSTLLFSYLDQIKSLEINLNPDLGSVGVRDCTFVPAALDSLVDALTSVSFNQPLHFSYDGTPALNQAQIDALRANNIDLSLG